MDEKVRYVKDDDWRSTHIKRRKVELAIKEVLEQYGINDEAIIDKIFDLVSHQKEY
jgi:type I restriction enzyme R subunit